MAISVKGKNDQWTVERTLQGLVGKGNFGIVYKGRNSKGEEIAAKLIDVSKHPRVVDQDVDRLLSLNHQNIVKIFDTAQQDDFFCIFMEYCAQGDLNSLFANNQLGVDKQLEIMTQIASGVVHLHCNDILHGNIKPSNVLVATLSPLVVKLSDFPLSQCLNESNRTSKRSSTSAPCGFEAPECFQPDEHGRIIFHKNVDIYSMALTFLAIIQATSEAKTLFPRIETPREDAERDIAVGQVITQRFKDGIEQLDIVAIDNTDEMVSCPAAIDECKRIKIKVRILIQKMTCVNLVDRLAAAEVLGGLQEMKEVHSMGERKQKLIGKTLSEHYLLAPVIAQDSSDSDISLPRHDDDEKSSVQSVMNREESVQILEKDESAGTSKTQKESNLDEYPSHSTGFDPSYSICSDLPDAPREIKRIGLERHTLLGHHLHTDVSAMNQVSSDQQVTTRQFQQRLNELITIIQPNKKGWNYDKFLQRIDKYLTAPENRYQEMRTVLIDQKISEENSCFSENFSTGQAKSLESHDEFVKSRQEACLNTDESRNNAAEISLTGLSQQSLLSSCLPETCRMQPFYPEISSIGVARETETMRTAFQKLRDEDLLLHAEKKKECGQTTTPTQCTLPISKTTDIVLVSGNNAEPALQPMETQNISLPSLRVQTSSFESSRRVPSSPAGPSTRRPIEITDCQNANTQHHQVVSNQIDVSDSTSMGISGRGPFETDSREIDLPLCGQYEHQRRLYRCNICGKDFRKFWNRHNHFLSVHKISKAHLPMYFPSIHGPRDETS